jgi:hypothetical protein
MTDMMTNEITHTEAVAIVAEAREATPSWQWAQSEEIGRNGAGKILTGRIDIGGLTFEPHFHGIPGNIWEIHWGPNRETYDVLRALDGRAGIFSKVVACLRDMTAEFVARQQPNDLAMNCASRKHAGLYMEHFPSIAAGPLSFRAETNLHRDPNKVLGIRFERNPKNRRRFDPNTFDFNVPRIPGEFAKKPDFAAETPTSKPEFDRLKFSPVCEIRPGLVWVEIENSTQANFAARAGRTPVDLYFDYEAKSESNRGRPAPHRWFMLASEVDGGIKGEVVMAAPGPGRRLRKITDAVAPLHIVGYDNAKAFPQWTDALAKLSDAVNIPMVPNYAGRDLTDLEATTEGWPKKAEVVADGPRFTP